MSRRQWMGLATAVLLLTAAFRLVALHDVPPGLSQDEVFNAGMVPFILEGNHALFFREAFGHEPLYHYWTIPFQLLLGDNWLAARLPAVVLGMLLVALLLAWGRREFGAGASIIAAVFVAISWWPIVFSRIGLRPIMLPVFLLLFAWFWPKRPLWAGVWLGLSLYTYTAARVVFLIPALMFLWGLVVEPRGAVWRWQEMWGMVWKPRSRDMECDIRYTALWVLIISLLVYAPLGITLWLDPSLQTRVADLSGPLEALQKGEWEPILETMRLTLGVFSFTGDPRWTYTLPNRPLFAPLTAVFFWLGCGITLLRWRSPRYALLLVWLGVGLLPSAITPQAPSTVRMVGAIPPTFFLLSIGFTVIWEFLTGVPILKSESTVATRSGIHVAAFGDDSEEDEEKQGLQRYLAHLDNPTQYIFSVTIPLAYYGLMFVALFSFWNGWRTVRDGFIVYPMTVEGRDKYQTIWQEVGDHWTANGGTLVVADAFFEQLDADTLRRNLGHDPAARWQQTGGLVLPAGGNGRLYVPEFAPISEELHDAVRLHLVDQSPISPRFTTFALPNELPQLAQPAVTTFGGALTLLGYELLLPDEEKPLRVLTLWQVEKPLPADLSFFVHLIQGEEIVGQHDGLDVVVTTLQAGDCFLQLHIVPDAAWQPDEQALQLGVYQRGDAVRWPLPDGADRFVLVP